MARKHKHNRFAGAIAQIGPLRILAALTIAIVGGWFALTLAVSGVARYKSPQAVLAILPSDSVALAARADQLLFADPARPSPAAAKLARAAIRQQAVNAKAIRILGYAADARGERLRALALVNMAARLSRREPGTQLWLIEHHAQTNDTVKTLNHYDILLTTKPDTQALLFPRLSNAIEDAPIRAALRPYLRRNRPWTGNFLWHAINTDKDLTNIVSLITEARGFPKNKPGDVTSREQEKALINRLVGENRFADAQRIYRMVPGANLTRLRDPAFDESDRDARFAAMNWRVSDDPNAGGSFIAKQGTRKPALSVFANAATTQTVASRLLYLRPARYLISIRLTQFDPGDAGYLQLQLRCPTANGSGPVWTASFDAKRGLAQFTVPTDCPVQFLDIVASGGKGQTGLEAMIDSIALTQ